VCFTPSGKAPPPPRHTQKVPLASNSWFDINPICYAAIMTIVHPARLLQYDTLIDGLERARFQGFVYERRAGDLSLWCYTSRAVYERNWDDFAVLARGLVVDRAYRVVVATPFPKFFNLSERAESIPDLPFDVLEKLDGSLIIAFSHRGAWVTATKGDLASAQALWAREILAAHPNIGALVPGRTYLFEAIGPQNRIVVKYRQAEMVLLAAYDADGRELHYDDLFETAAALDWRVAARHHFSDLADLVRHAEALPRSEEGFVVRFSNGLRLKIKGAEYRRIHAIISRITPLAIWESLAAGDDLDRLRTDVPEEYWGDFDSIRALLMQAFDDVLEKARAAAAVFDDVADRDVAARLGEVAADVRPYVFAIRKGQVGGKLKANLFRAIRPTGNALPGYVPSFAMNQATADE
jgi:RNA ligase